jgi:FlaA1/EpsC-like NDP-sugar epimerase
MAVTDGLALVLAIVLTRLAQLGRPVITPQFLLLLVLAPIVWVGTFAALQLYSISRLSPAEEFRRVLEATGVAVGVQLAVSMVFNDASILGAISHGWLALAAGLALLFVLVERQAWHRHMGRLRVQGELAYRTLILGANEEAVKIAESLQP